MIGEKIKAARVEKGITAKDLAEKAEVTPGYISQIERNLISPSLSVLMRIAEAIEIPLVSLFSQEEEQEQVTVITRDNRTKIQFADINMEYQFVTPYSRNTNACTKMEMLCFKLGAKSWGSTMVQYHEEAAECTLVLKGILEYHIGDSVYTLKEGDSIYVPQQTYHQLYNPGDEDVEAVAVISPALY
ncbi:XRE family transcriptional regulator [Anaerotignum sp.]|uniref:XRE family transcriptional regulator n=1 Tax=Anaerotignum sp. TaxID=2039241 RepID=UPI002714BF6C|nr:XRE family transcriptional regulator [Anaerotignum sp.]